MRFSNFSVLQIPNVISITVNCKTQLTEVQSYVSAAKAIFENSTSELRSAAPSIVFTWTNCAAGTNGEH